MYQILKYQKCNYINAKNTVSSEILTLEINLRLLKMHLNICMLNWLRYDLPCRPCSALLQQSITQPQHHMDRITYRYKTILSFKYFYSLFQYRLRRQCMPALSEYTYIHIHNTVILLIALLKLNKIKFSISPYTDNKVQQHSLAESDVGSASMP